MKKFLVSAALLLSSVSQAAEVDVFALSATGTTVNAVVPSLGVGVNTYAGPYGRLGLTYADVTVNQTSTVALAAQLSYIGGENQDGISLSIGGGGFNNNFFWVLPTLNYTEYRDRDDHDLGFSTSLGFAVGTKYTTASVGYQEGPKCKGVFAGFELGL